MNIAISGFHDKNLLRTQCFPQPEVATEPILPSASSSCFVSDIPGVLGGNKRERDHSEIKHKNDKAIDLDMRYWPTDIHQTKAIISLNLQDNSLSMKLSDGNFHLVFGGDKYSWNGSDFNQLTGPASCGTNLGVITNAMRAGGRVNKYMVLYTNDTIPTPTHISVSTLSTHEACQGQSGVILAIYTFRSANFVGNAKCYGLGLIPRC